MPKGSLSLIKKPPTDEEKQLLNQLTSPKAKIEVLMPDEITMKDWLKITETVCRGIGRARLQEESLVPVLGRLLILAEDHPEIWNSKYQTFDEFQKAEVWDKWGVGRSTCYDAKRMMRRFQVSSVDYEQIGRRNMLVLMQAIPKGDENTSTAKDLLKKAKELPANKFRELCEEKNYIEKGDTTGSYIRIGTSKKIKKFVEAFMDNPDVHAYVGSSNWGKIQYRMVQECTATWLAEVADKRADESDRADHSEELSHEEEREEEVAAAS